MKKGDIISVDYEVWILDDEKDEEKKLLETTNEELAKENDIHSEGAHYHPADFIIGKELPFVKVDESFLDAEVGKEVELLLEPIDAYGVREMDKITFKKKSDLESQEEGNALFAGARIKLKRPVEGLEGEGVIRAGGSRMIQVDFNHPLAGRQVLCKYTVTKKYEELAEIINALFGSYSHRIESVDFTEDGETLRITLPEICKVDNNWTFAKLFVVTSLREATEFKTIVLEERYESRKPEEEPTDSEEETPVEPETEITVELPQTEEVEEEEKPETNEVVEEQKE